MSDLTPEQATAYLKRWELVREVEAAELQRTPVEMKFRQLSALMASRGMFADDPQRQPEIELVRERWARLRKALGA
jgi:hypothetical protein